MYLLSKLPNVFGFTQVIYEIDVGTLQVPVILDGQIDQREWNNDTFAYQPSWSVGNLANFVFRAKYDSTYTYMALYAPKMTVPGYGELNIDPKTTGSLAKGAKGVYTLALKPSTNGWYESPRDPIGAHLTGIPIAEMFDRGTDYDWAGSYFNGMQLEFKFKNDILLKGALNNAINFNAYVQDMNAPYDGAAFNGSGYTRMVFHQEVLPEFDSESTVLLGSLVGALAATRLAKKHLSRRDLLFLR